MNCYKIIARLALLASLFLSGSVLAGDKTTFVYAKINESIMPIARGEKYAGPLDSALKEAKLGEVTGGGSSLSKRGTVAWVGIDIELTNLTVGIPFVVKKLRELGAPKGSVLEYEVKGKTVVVQITE